MLGNTKANFFDGSHIGCSNHAAMRKLPFYVLGLFQIINILIKVYI